LFCSAFVLPFIYALNSSLLLLLLEVLVGVESSETTDKDDRVETDAETSALCVGSWGDGTGEGGLGLGVTSLCKRVSNVAIPRITKTAGSGRSSYLALQHTDLEGLESLAGLVAVADILERLGGILAGDVEKDLLTAAIRRRR
jgi:hypothetical protein